MIERPLDFLNEKKLAKEDVKIITSRKEEIKGKIIAFDIHINIVLSINGKNVFLRGDNILEIR